MLYAFDIDFIMANKDYFDEIIKDTMKDMLYAIGIYAFFIIFGILVI